MMPRPFNWQKPRPTQGLSGRLGATASLALVAIAGSVFGASPAQAQVTPITTTPIFSDDFNGTQLDPEAWWLHSTAYFLARTQYGNSPTTGKDPDGTTFLKIPISTYNPNPGKAGVQFFGTEVMSRDKWPMGSGLEYEFRMRSNRLPSGLVLGLFPYGDYGKWTSTYQKTEIDYEFLTKQPGSKVWLNIWDDWNPERGGPRGDGLSDAPGLDWNNGGWNTYRIRQYPDRTEWIVNNNQIIRTDRTVKPGAPMGLWLNVWAAESSWGIAYDANLKPVNSAALSTTYSYDVDYVRVRPIPATSGVWGTGTGLTARYYDNADFTRASVMRTDHRINFDWGTYAPDPSLGVDSYSARWTGTVQAQYTETYTFTVKSDDGVRLWVNNKQLVNNWVTQGATEKSATIAMVAGTKYAIKLEYFDNTGGASCQLFWSSPSTPRQLVPQCQLYPEAVLLKPVFTPSGGSYSTAQKVTIKSPTNGATIRYTLDGTEPTELSPTLVAGRTLAVNVSQLVRAKAFASGKVPSDTATANYVIAKETKQPVAAVTAPLSGSMLRAMPSSITGTASDGADGSGISRVTVQIRRLSDGLRWNGSTWISTDYGLLTTLTAKPLANDPSNVTWICKGPFPSGTNAPNGTYEIKTFAYDVAGNVNNMNVAPARAEFIIDTLAPTISITSPANSATVTSMSGIVGTVADQVGGSGVDRVALVLIRRSDSKQWNGSAWVTAASNMPALVSGGNWSVVSPAANGAVLPTGANLPDGSYNLRALAYDKIGNMSFAQIVVNKKSSVSTASTSVQSF